MAVSPTGTDVAVAYTSQAIVERYLPLNAITDAVSASGSGKVTTDDLTTIINEQSRVIDGRLWGIGYQVPFPAIAATNPQTPRPIVLLCSYLVAAEVRTVLKHGNRKTPSASAYGERAEALFEQLESGKGHIGYGRVSSPENFNVTASSGTNQYGKLTANYYRLKNPGLRPNSLRFVKSTGVEAFRSDGLPFDYGRDWSIVSHAQSVIALFNEASIIDAIGSGGGAVYEFSWRRLDWGQAHPTPLYGVSWL